MVFLSFGSFGVLWRHHLVKSPASFCGSVVAVVPSFLDLIQWSGWKEHAARFLMALWETVRPSHLHPVPFFPTVYIISQTVIIREALFYMCSVWMECSLATNEGLFFVVGSGWTERLVMPHQKCFLFQAIKLSTGEVFAKTIGESVGKTFFFLFFFF